MAITLSSLGLEGQSPSSLEDDDRGHAHLHDSPLRKGGRWPWPSFPSPLEEEEQTSSFSEDGP